MGPSGVRIPPASPLAGTTPRVAAGAAVDPSDGLADVSHVSESWSELGKDSEDEGDEWDNRSAHTDCTDPYCPGAPASEGSDEEDDAWIAE